MRHLTAGTERGERHTYPVRLTRKPWRGRHISPVTARPILLPQLYSGRATTQEWSGRTQFWTSVITTSGGNSCRVVKKCFVLLNQNDLYESDNEPKNEYLSRASRQSMSDRGMYGGLLMSSSRRPPLPSSPASPPPPPMDRLLLSSAHGDTPARTRTSCDTQTKKP